MRETGPAFKNLDDSRRAAPYVGAARALLGALKNDMAFNSLQQGTRRLDLPDGTRITVESRFGIDKFAIATTGGAEVQGEFKPEFAQPVPPTEVSTETINQYVEGKRFRVCGYCTSDEGDRAAFWPNPREVINLGLLPNGNRSQATAISDDGTAVVGFCRVIGEGNHGFIWRATTGMVDLGAAPNQNLWDVNPQDCSEDGAYVVGYAPDQVYVQIPFVWTALSGIQRLPGGRGTAKRVSANGRYILGTLTGYGACVWAREGAAWIGPVVFDPPGTQSPVSIVGPAAFDPTTFQADTWVPVDVADDGLVTVASSHYTLGEQYSTTTFWDQGGGVPAPYVSGVEGAVSTRYVAVNGADVRTFNASTGHRTYHPGVISNIAFLTAGVQQPAAHSDDAYALVGTDSRATYYTYELWNRPAPPNAISRVKEWPSILAQWTVGWVWNPRRGKRELGDYTSAADIDETASIIVGHRVQGDYTYPVFWTAGGLRARDLPLIPGTWGGRTLRVSAMRSISPDPVTRLGTSES